MSDMALSLRYSLVRLVNPARGEMSDMELLSRLKLVRLVNPATGEMSDMELSPRLKLVRLVNPATGEMSDIVLLPRLKLVRLVNPATGGMSDMELLSRYRPVRLVNPARGERSDTELLLMERPSASTYSAPRNSNVRLVAASSPAKLLMLTLRAKSSVNRAISSVVITASDALPSPAAIAARRLGSGMSAAGSGTSLKVTDSEIPSTLARTLFVPVSGPSVSRLSALPLASVIALVALSVPPPEMTVNVTVTPSCRRPLSSLTSTISRLSDSVTVPEIFRRAVGVRINSTVTPLFWRAGM